jgi:hypothetical protein
VRVVGPEVPGRPADGDTAVRQYTADTAVPVLEGVDAEYDPIAGFHRIPPFPLDNP